MKVWTLAAVFILVGIFAGCAQDSADGWSVVADPTNSVDFMVMKGGQTLVRVGVAAWGPNWGWTEVSSRVKAVNGILSFKIPVKLGDKTVDLLVDARLADPSTLKVTYTVDAQVETPLTLLCVTLSAPNQGKTLVQLEGPGGGSVTSSLPAGRRGFGQVNSLAVSDEKSTKVFFIKTDSTIGATADGDIRLFLAQNKIPAGQTQETFSFRFPDDVEFLAGNDDVDRVAPLVPGPDWFPWTPSWSVKGEWNSKPSLVGMESWLDSPAGSHGGVRMVGDQFQFEDGTPVKFWGLNLAFGASAPSKEDADHTAARFAKYGVNAVRMHKFTGSDWEGIGDPNFAEKMTPDGLDRLDYFTAQLTKRGVYYGWSHTFQYKVKAGDKARLSGYDELMAKGGNTYAVINWAEDVQDLLIETVVNLLKHKNPYTGKHYFEDPALNFIELQNEDDIFFYTSGPAYQDFPTYRKQLQVQFVQWLKAKYGTRDKLAAAWGSALRGSEQFDPATVEIQMNPWFMGDQSLPGQSGGSRQRLLDNAAFLHDTQDRFYSRFIKAIRATGYKGPIVGSPWQAPAMLPHYYNLDSDFEAGYIDRHDYFGSLVDDTMLATPGGGYLSAGLQQVADRPFSLSEWISAYPCLYSAEGPLLVGAYGLGLQGWGSSYEFQSTSGEPGKLVGQFPWGIWNADGPTQIGQFPAISRMVLRGDVKEAPVLTVRRVSPENLKTGKFDFTDVVAQQGDVKTFTGSVPPETLAVGRDLVEFVAKTQQSTFADLGPHWAGDDLVSTTGQLKWNPKARVVRIDTAGTQGFVGFAQDQKLEFADVSMVCATPYAMVLATAMAKDKTLKTDDTVLISAVARNANKGMRVLAADRKTVVDNGTEPILLEPVRVKVTFGTRKVAEVKVLDSDGRATSRSVTPGADGSLDLDTGRDRAMYYLVTFEP